jgi:pimeloyl-ACP methyl ester carboxylesterase
MAAMRRSLIAFCGLLLAGAAAAQVDEVLTARRDGYSISGLATRQESATAFRHGVALFPGHPGILRLELADGQPRYEMRGNFLVRSRRHWLDPDILVLVLDAPSDQWATFTQGFRATARYGADVRALLEEASLKYKIEQWSFVGTSEGSISAFHAARMNPGLAGRVILTSSLFSPTRNGNGLSDADWSQLKAPLLLVHHENDPCQYTSYAEARRYAEKTRAALVTVRGGGPEKGGACQAFTAHGFVGVERAVVRAMRSWVRTGAVPADVQAGE